MVGVNRLSFYLSAAALIVMTGCSTTIVREQPHEIRLGEDGARLAAAPLAEALLEYRGTAIQSVQGRWKDREFSAECVVKGIPGRFTAIFLAPQMRLATLVITPPRTLSFDRARQIPDAFEPEYAVFDLAVVNLSAESLRRALGEPFTVVERDGKRTVSAAGSPLAVRTVLPDGSVRYENVSLEYTFVLKEVK